MTRLGLARVVAYLLVVGLGGIGVFRVEREIDARARSERIEDARDCLEVWDRYRGALRVISDAAEVGALVGTDAHLDLLMSTDAERHQAHGFIAERLPRQLRPVLETYPQPECDEDHARWIVDEES